MDSETKAILDGEQIDAIQLINAYREKVDQLHTDLMTREAQILRIVAQRTTLEQQLLDAGVIPATQPQAALPEPPPNRTGRRGANGQGSGRSPKGGQSAT